MGEKDVFFNELLFFFLVKLSLVNLKLYSEML